MSSDGYWHYLIEHTISLKHRVGSSRPSALRLWFKCRQDMDHVWSDRTSAAVGVPAVLFSCSDMGHHYRLSIRPRLGDWVLIRKISFVAAITLQREYTVACWSPNSTPFFHSQITSDTILKSLMHRTHSSGISLPRCLETHRRWLLSSTMYSKYSR